MSTHLFRATCEGSCRSLATSLIFHMKSEHSAASTADRERNQMMTWLRKQKRPEIERISIEAKELESRWIGGSP